MANRRKDEALRNSRYGNPALPLPRFLRRVVEALGKGPQRTAELARRLGVGINWIQRGLRFLIQRGDVAEITLSPYHHRFVCLSRDAVAIRAALGDALEAERAYHKAWEKVAAARAALDAALTHQAPAILAPAPAPAPAAGS